MSLKSAVRWVKGARGKFAVGLEFGEVPDPLRVEIAAFVVSMSDLPPPMAR